MQSCETCKHRSTKDCPVQTKALIVGETSQLTTQGFCDRYSPILAN
ncbi:hypothetical protein NG796_01730 [Laspinema sp. A4]|nr:hypothetical protein [Laspinema sp. D2d]